MVVALVVLLLVALLWPAVHQYGARGLVIQAGFALALLFRRVAPLSVLLLMAVSTILLLALGQWAPNLLLATIGDRDQTWILLSGRSRCTAGWPTGRTAAGPG